MKNKRTFNDFLKIIYRMNYNDYEALDTMQQKAIEIDYINRYGTPIKWF